MPDATESLTLENDESGSRRPSTSAQFPAPPPRRGDLDRDSSTDVSTARRVLSDDLAAAVAQRPPPPAEPSYDDEEDDADELPTIVRMAPMPMQDRLIVQPRKAAVAPQPTPQAPPAPIQAARQVAPAPFPVAAPERPEPFAPPVSGPAPAPSHLRVPPGVTTGSNPAVASPASGPYPQAVQQAPVNMQPPPTMQAYPGYPNPYVTGGNLSPYDAADPGFDETQWARGLRGSPILVYAAAAVGGFLIVAVLIAVLLGGPDRDVDPVPAPPPTTTAP